MHLDVMSRTPVYEQIIDEIRRFILSGVYKPGDQLPSVRGLSMELSINPNTILKAYGELDAQGVIFSIPGKGYFIHDAAKERLKDSELNKLDSIRQQLIEIALAGIDKQTVYSCVENAYLMAEEIDRGNEK